MVCFAGCLFLLGYLSKYPPALSSAPVSKSPSGFYYELLLFLCVQNSMDSIDVAKHVFEDTEFVRCIRNLKDLESLGLTSRGPFPLGGPSL